MNAGAGADGRACLPKVKWNPTLSVPRDIHPHALPTLQRTDHPDNAIRIV